MAFHDEIQKRIDAPPSFETPAGNGGRLSLQPHGPGARTTTYKIDQGVFVLYRPVETCSRCRADSDPEDAYTCPHIKKEAYLKILQACHEGKWRLLHWKEETLKNGTVQSTVTWGVPQELAERPKRTVPVL